MPRCYIALGCCFVSVASPEGDEGGEVPVVFMQGDAMVAIPAVKHGLFRATWYGACLVERTLCVVGFPGGVEVQCLEVDCATWLAIFLGTYHHAVTPSDGLSDGDWFNDT